MNNSPQKIGIFGGTFNPVHIGHLIIAQEVMLAKKLDQIRFLPNANPPHKQDLMLIDAKHRFEMIRLATESYGQFAVDDYEMQYDGYSYTIDTMSHFENAFKNTQLYFIIGADSLLELFLWKDAQTLVDRFSFIIALRNGSELNVSVFAQLPFEKRLQEKLANSVVQTPMIDIASRNIRDRIKKSMPVRFMLPDNVIQYIEKHNLYGYKKKED
ncbi:MAG: nicotinate-nucleotide adenylyltransferase [Candidatus Auribacterota bacterium]|nr:nicotinate-nucleotide adenylyltransferase [Candidatus Auribacterota bacterium]